MPAGIVTIATLGYMGGGYLVIRARVCVHTCRPSGLPAASMIFALSHPPPPSRCLPKDIDLPLLGGVRVVRRGGAIPVYGPALAGALEAYTLTRG
mmetsp:Transcript_78988/g.109443  ORF Transcript_78988/g.109443 Transcript_78988/m.109443 type:complete len:95 (+) Transcript_78988:761-1045(+)